MPIFKYSAVDEKGKIYNGILEGESLQNIRQVLQDRGLLPIEIVPRFKKIYVLKIFDFFKSKKIDSGKLSLLSYQLSMLLSAGLPLESALLNLGNQMENIIVKSALLSIRASIVEGYTFAYSLELFPDLFPKIYSITVASGEKSGQLDKVIYQLYVYFEQQEKIKQKIQQALIYPALLTLVSFAIITFLLLYAMPKIIAIFVENKQDLPIITAVLLAITHFLHSYGLYILIFSILLGFGFFFLLQLKSFRYKFHLFLLKLPIFKSIFIMLNTTQFLKTLAILFSAKIPVLAAMRLANNIVTLLPMQDQIEKSIVKVNEGVSIHQALLQTQYFSPISLQLILSGEAINKLDLMVNKAALYQEQYILKWIDTLLSLFEPFMIMVMGLIVLFIVLAMLLPIFQMNQFY